MAPGKLDDFQQIYETEIEATGGIDLQLLGVGRNGHIGFNEPGSSMASRTRVKTLTQATLKDNSRLFKEEEFQPALAMTMGIATILDAREVVLMATGASKAEAVMQTVEGSISAKWPSTALQMHPKVTLVVDQAASTALANKDYYRDAFVKAQELA